MPAVRGCSLLVGIRKHGIQKPGYRKVHKEEEGNVPKVTVTLFTALPETAVEPYTGGDHLGQEAVSNLQVQHSGGTWEENCTKSHCLNVAWETKGRGPYYALHPLWGQRSTALQFPSWLLLPTQRLTLGNPKASLVLIPPLCWNHLYHLHCHR